MRERIKASVQNRGDECAVILLLIRIYGKFL